MKIGIIGGGQLGMMMAKEAKSLGHTIMSLDPSPSCSITHYSDCHISKPYNDKEALEYIYDSCDVITYEFENIDLEVLREYADKLPQGIEALKISRNRVLEKEFARDLRIEVPSYQEVHSIDDIFVPSIVKSVSGGYDGKGQYKVATKIEAKNAFLIAESDLICEEFIPFDYEISVIGTRGKNGDCVFFPVPVNIHKNGILHLSIVDGSVPDAIVKQAKLNTKHILEELNYVGTLAVEYFVKDEKVIFNEFAPRPHNSGHYTINGCDVSQFKTHVLAITGEELPIPKLINKSVMINVLGQNKKYYRNARSIEHTHIHDYLKKSTKENRKIGHINITYHNNQDITKIIQTIIEE
jgi:5-(carboxyamino)imidazole ribonucleotide synthase